jgi:hypothetical protein
MPLHIITGDGRARATTIHRHMQESRPRPIARKGQA